MPAGALRAILLRHQGILQETLEYNFRYYCIPWYKKTVGGCALKAKQKLECVLSELDVL